MLWPRVANSLGLPTTIDIVLARETATLRRLPCQSHYWIKRSTVQWSPHWSPEEIAAGRALDTLAKQRQFSLAKTMATETAKAVPDELRPFTGEDG
jgi:hypothetical protein